MRTTTHTYQPPTETPQLCDAARKRGLLSEGETLADGRRRVADALGSIDLRLGGGSGFAHDLLAGFEAGRLAPSSQLYAAAGNHSNAGACTVLPTVGTTDAERTNRLIAETVGASRRGLGCGVDLSMFDDPVSALNELNAAIVDLAEQLRAENRRPPALMVSCSAEHPHIADFINAKRGADFTEWIANISVRLTGSEPEWERLQPLLARAAHHNGEPGVLFQDVADADNPTPQLPIISTAPCAEVFLSPGEQCIFLSVNLAAHVRGNDIDFDMFAGTVAMAVRGGDAAVELASADGASVVAQRRRIGVGVCGYHSALISMGIAYEESTLIAKEVAEHLSYAAHTASIDLAEQRGAFPLFEQSRWLDPLWVARKSNRRVGAVPDEQWHALAARIERHGIRHSAVVAHPPTGVVALLMGVSRSYEPHFALNGQTGVASKFEDQLVPEAATRRALVKEDNDPVLACASQVSVKAHLDVHEAFSGMADESGSKTVNLPSTATVEAVGATLAAARSRGLKGLTVFRDGCLDHNMRTRV